MTKQEILDNIKTTLLKGTSHTRNSMGVSESFYNPFYSMGIYFSQEKLESFSEEELQNLYSFGEFLAEAFY